MLVAHSGPTEPFLSNCGIQIDALVTCQEKNMGEDIGALLRELLSLLVIAESPITPHALQVHKGLRELTQFLLQFQCEPHVVALQPEFRSVTTRYGLNRCPHLPNIHRSNHPFT